ncbi:hypothetical protein N7530_011592 [Penicillium desertorum]|jgi:hypothetical protein|uniref:Uncharacterized protein n=1 Tax=Penicillium desertorum TaxID=1303715 RepID=A0A9W9WDU6_9EURO|nr:hypothetical protein N7530_011592 [Penicillium desertorum]
MNLNELPTSDNVQHPWNGLTSPLCLVPIAQARQEISSWMIIQLELALDNHPTGSAIFATS